MIAGGFLRATAWPSLLLLCVSTVTTRGGASPAAQGAATFSSRVDTVRVDVSVRQGAEAVRGLTAADFELFDNGVRQQIDLAGFEETPVSVVLMLDMSRSVQGPRLEALRQAGVRLTQLLEPGDVAALVTFTDRVAIRSGFTADTQRLVEGLRQTAHGVDTSLVDAVHAALVLGETESSGRTLVIAFSDGADTASFLAPANVLDTARRTEAVVYAVTSSGSRRDEFLDDLVRVTGGRRLEIASLDRLSGAFAEILAEARERYLLSYTPNGVPAAGWHELTVRVKGRRAEVRARPGYLAPSTP